MEEERKKNREDFERNHADFMKKWHEKIKTFPGLEKFNHKGGIKDFPSNKMRTLEIGAATGNHTETEDRVLQQYEIVELDIDLVEFLQYRFPETHVYHGDICTFNPGKRYHRIIAIHVLEHIPNLPLAINNMFNLLEQWGYADVIIPCEGGLTYSIGRRLTSKPLYEKIYGTSYDDYIRHEHVHTAEEIILTLRQSRFNITWMKAFPFSLITPFPLGLFNCINSNICIGLRIERWSH